MSDEEGAEATLGMQEGNRAATRVQARGAGLSREVLIIGPPGKTQDTKLL